MAWAKTDSGTAEYVDLNRCVNVRADLVGADWHINVVYVDGTGTTMQRLDGNFATQSDAETVVERLVASQGGLVNPADLL